MSPDALHPLLLQPSEVVGSYRLVRRIATGGYGTVFLAEADGHPVALKFALQGPEDAADSARVDARTMKEVSVLSRVTHPNVVALRGYNRWPHPRTGYLFLVMDYVDGPTLSEWARTPLLTSRQVAMLFADLALTLDAIHREGVRHRDIKGSNIIVRASDGRPVLVDFGSGDHASAPVLTDGRLPPGTPSYRSPESLQYWMEHREHGPRYTFRPTDDLYSLGLVLFEVLTGTFPYPATLPPTALLGSILSARAPLPHRINPQVPRALSGVCRRLLERSPSSRYQTGAELYAALNAALEQGSASWEQPLFVPPPPEDAVTEEDEAMFDGNEEARELRRWVRSLERPMRGGESKQGASSRKVALMPVMLIPPSALAPARSERSWVRDWGRRLLAWARRWRMRREGRLGHFSTKQD
ncbi:serine/threonine protein kinase [Corallococcus sp. M34]|uniref:serine/threonine-protein kinase n=1 Tax=Citreicoccus inhibens TaxID=2849499 RepID=UPI001C2420D6|nr:serine/threonine-protein kinase [Citreicoccus inhibens]MBU8897336.1 serine/threonine protein kinase [Citreicoccus inhibens]